jgi:hypothetical protein
VAAIERLLRSEQRIAILRGTASPELGQRSVDRSTFVGLQQIGIGGECGGRLPR